MYSNKDSSQKKELVQIMKDFFRTLLSLQEDEKRLMRDYQEALRQETKKDSD